MSKTKEAKHESVETGKDDLKPCFIITPIGEINSEINIKARGLIDTVMTPELKEFGFKPLPAYRIADAGSINKQVLENILTNELVIVNLTGLNPNVMYELAVRHAVRKPVITMAEAGTRLPFDIVDQRTIFYHDTLAGSLVAREKLAEAIEAVLKTEVVDNPIYQVSQEISILKKDSKENDVSINEYIIKRLDGIERAVGSINRSSTIKPFISQGTESRFTVHLQYKGTKLISNRGEELWDLFKQHNIEIFEMVHDGNKTQIDFFGDMAIVESLNKQLMKMGFIILYFTSTK